MVQRERERGRRRQDELLFMLDFPSFVAHKILVSSRIYCFYPMQQGVGARAMADVCKGG